MSRQFWANLALGVFLVVLAMVALTRMGSVLTPKGLFVSDPQPSGEAAPLLPHVNLTAYDLRKNQENLIEAAFRISNNSRSSVKNIRVLCEFQDEQGRFMDRKWWSLPETVQAGEDLVITTAARRFVNSRARVVDCRIADFQLVKPPFFTLDRSSSGGHDAPAGDGPGSGHDTGHAGGH